MPLATKHLHAGSVREGALGVWPALIAPGATTAGTSISLPSYARPARRILDALLLKTGTVSAVHAACGASGAAYTSDTDIISPTGEAVVTEAKKLTVVTGTPSAGEIALADENSVVLGEDTAADDVLIVLVELA